MMSAATVLRICAGQQQFDFYPLLLGAKEQKPFESGFPRIVAQVNVVQLPRGYLSK